MKLAANISQAEWEVMRCLWDQAPLPAATLVETLAAQRGWRPRTTRTLLDRLVRKGAVAFALEGKRFLYRPRLSRAATVRRESRSFMERVFGGEPAAMLIHLVRQTELTAAEIQELKRLLEEKEP